MSWRVGVDDPVGVDRQRPWLLAVRDRPVDRRLAEQPLERAVDGLDSRLPGSDIDLVDRIGEIIEQVAEPLALGGGRPLGRQQLRAVVDRDDDLALAAGLGESGRLDRYRERLAVGRCQRCVDGDRFVVAEFLEAVGHTLLILGGNELDGGLAEQAFAAPAEPIGQRLGQQLKPAVGVDDTQHLPDGFDDRLVATQALLAGGTGEGGLGVGRHQLDQLSRLLGTLLGIRDADDEDGCLADRYRRQRCRLANVGAFADRLTDDGLAGRKRLPDQPIAGRDRLTRPGFSVNPLGCGRRHQSVGLVVVPPNHRPLEAERLGHRFDDRFGDRSRRLGDHQLPGSG